MLWDIVHGDVTRVGVGQLINALWRCCRCWRVMLSPMWMPSVISPILCYARCHSIAQRPKTAFRATLRGVNPGFRWPYWYVNVVRYANCVTHVAQCLKSTFTGVIIGQQSDTCRLLQSFNGAAPNIDLNLKLLNHAADNLTHFNGPVNISG